MSTDPSAQDPADDAALSAALDDLGRRIDAAKADSEARAGSGPPRRFPLAWVGVGLVVAILVGLFALANSNRGDDVAAGAGSTAGSTTSTSALVVTTSTAPGGAPATEATPTSERVEPTTTVPSTTAPPTTATPTTVSPTTATPTTAPPSTTPPAPAANSPGAATEVTVAAGDSFWRIADGVVSERLGHPASDAEIVGYWAQLVAANADRLVQPGNPDLIFPGQVLVLPAGTG